MQEYLFNKEDLRRLIEESGDEQNRIAVTLDLKRPQDGIRARAVKFESGKTIESTTDSTTVRLTAASDGSLTGCPNPPGC